MGSRWPTNFTYREALSCKLDIISQLAYFDNEDVLQFVHDWFSRACSTHRSHLHVSHRGKHRNDKGGACTSAGPDTRDEERRRGATTCWLYKSTTCRRSLLQSPRKNTQKHAKTRKMSMRKEMGTLCVSFNTRDGPVRSGLPCWQRRSR